MSSQLLKLIVGIAATSKIFSNEIRTICTHRNKLPQSPDAVNKIVAENPEEFVNVLGGTDSRYDISHGSTIPFAAVPWGFNSYAPQTDDDPTWTGWWFHPYDRRFFGLRVSHQPSPWISDYGNFMIKGYMPVRAGAVSSGDDYTGYSPKQTIYSPYLFSTALLAYSTAEEETRLDFAPTSHGGILRMSFPKYDAPLAEIDRTGAFMGGFEQTRRISIKLNGGSDAAEVGKSPLGDGAILISGFTTKNSGGVSSSALFPSQVEKQDTSSGTSTTAGAAMRRLAELQRPEASTGEDGSFAHYFAAVLYGGADGDIPLAFTEETVFSASSGTTWVDFAPDQPEHQTITVRFATSFISVEQALQNLQAEVGLEKSFVQVAMEAKQAWNDALSRVKVASLTSAPESSAAAGAGGAGATGYGVQELMDLATTFYSSLYRASLFPRSLGEVTADGTVQHWSPYLVADLYVDLVMNPTSPRFNGLVDREILSPTSLVGANPESIDNNNNGDIGSENDSGVSGDDTDAVPDLIDEGSAGDQAEGGAGDQAEGGTNQTSPWGMHARRSPIGSSAIAAGELSTDSGFWDAWNTVYPLLTLTNRPQLGKTMQGWLNAYLEGGWLPKWASPGYRGSMVGTMGDVSLADAIVNDIPGFDVDLAYEAIRKDAFEEPPVDSAGVGRECLSSYQLNGYVAYDAGCTETVARTLNYWQSDYAIAQAASKLGKTSDVDTLRIRAASFPSLFDTETGFFRSRTPQTALKSSPEASTAPNNNSISSESQFSSNATFTEPFDEFSWGGDYTEAGPWQYRFYVPYDPAGLATLYAESGRPDMCANLEAVHEVRLPTFHLGGYTNNIKEMTEMADICWGQYAHNDQIVHHQLYMYMGVDCAAQGQYRIRQVLRELYTPDADMFAGDEDNGEMGAWYVLSALGLYELSPGSGEFVLGSPLFGRVEIDISDIPSPAAGASKATRERELEHLKSLGISTEEKKLVIQSVGNSRENVYVQRVTWNGEEVSGHTIQYAALAQGGELTFYMGAEPATATTTTTAAASNRASV